MRKLGYGSLALGVLALQFATGCSSAGDKAKDEVEPIRSREQLVVDFTEAEAAIRAAWRTFNYCPNSSACIGHPYQATSELAFVPGSSDEAVFQRYEQSLGYPSVVVFSELFGAVVLESWEFDAWLGLSGQTAEDGSDLFEYIGMPRPEGGFERGVIDRLGIAVTGHIYSRYVIYEDEFGSPVSPETDVFATDGTVLGRIQAFDHGEIYWKDGVGAFAIPHGEVMDAWKANGGPTGELGFPIAEVMELEQPVEVVGNSGSSWRHPATGRFEGGGVFYYPNTGAHALTGDFFTAFEQEHGGVNGFLGFPISDIGSVPATGDNFVDFQGGILITHDDADGNNRMHVFSDFDFFLDRMQDRDEDCWEGICGQAELRPDVKITTPEGVIYDERLGYERGNSDPQLNLTWSNLGDQAPLSQWFAEIEVKVVEIDGWPDPDDQKGTVRETYSIENLWGQDGSISTKHSTGDISVWFSLKSNIPFGEGPFRNEQWWSFRNFSTERLSYDQYAQTFVDVAASDEWWRDPLNKLLYEVVYRKMAKNGNCFGMGVESIHATLGTSPYAQPIFQYLPERWDDGEKPDASIPAHAAMMEEINVKQGYQLGSDFVAYSIGMFLSGMTHEPGGNFDLSQLASAAGQYPLLSVSGYFGARAHSLRPYHWSTTGDVTSGTLFHEIKIADPNFPWGNHQGEDIMTITRTVPYSSFDYRDYSGGTFHDGRMFFQPLSVFQKQPYTPFGVIGQAIDSLNSFIIGENARTEQITDGEGRKFFVEGLSEPPSRYDDILADDSARIPNLAPLPISDGDGDEDIPAQFFASRGRGETLHYDIVGNPDVADGTNYDAIFTTEHLSAAFDVPGTQDKADRISAHRVNRDDAAVSFRVPDDGVSKNIDVVINGALKSRWAQLRDLRVEPGQQITLSLSNGGSDLQIENDGPDTTAIMTIRHGRENEIVEVGEIDIPSGTTETQFKLPETTLTLSNDVYGNNDWLIVHPTVELEAFDYSGQGIQSIDWSNDGQATWTITEPEDSSISFVYDTEGESTIWYRATDEAFNAELPKSQDFAIDTRVPVVEVSAGSGTFTRIETFIATASAMDPMPGSGIYEFVVAVDGGTVEANSLVDIFWFTLGEHVLDAEAEDYAGWETSDAAAFEVVATLEDLPETVRELGRRGEVTNWGVLNSLVQKAENALASKENGNINAARNQLEAMIHELNAQSGKQVSHRAADLLRGDIQYVLNSL